MGLSPIANAAVPSGPPYILKEYLVTIFVDGFLRAQLQSRHDGEGGVYYACSNAVLGCVNEVSDIREVIWCKDCGAEVSA